MLAVNSIATSPAVQSCRHCGDPCEVPVVDGDATFCCSGCQSVYALIASEGLHGYYACAEAPGASQRHSSRRAPDRFAALDDADVAAAFIEFQDRRLARARLRVPAIHCASCVWLLEQLWRVVPGVVGAETDLLHQVVRVSYRPDDTSLRRIAEGLGALGYEPTIASEDPAPAMPRSRRRLYRQLGVAGFAFGNMMIFSIPRYASGRMLDDGFQGLFDALNLTFAIPVLVFSASDWFRNAWSSLRLGRVTLDLPVALGLSVIFTRSLGDILARRGEGFLDSFAGLVFFLLIGRLFQQKTFEQLAFDRSYRSFLPLSVRVERDGGIDTVPLEKVPPGADIVVRPHEIVPADSVVREGHGAVDYAFATGEQTPVSVSAGAVVQAGGRVVGPTLRLRLVGEVAPGRLASLWTHPVMARARRAWVDEVSDRFGRWFTVGALGVAAIGALWWWPDVRTSASVATAVLIVACPCALTLAAPVALGTALGQLGRRGLYLRDTAAMFALGGIDVITFDKTGTLTTPTSPVVTARGGQLTADDWRLVRAAAAESIHPVSRALAGAGVATGVVRNIVETPGAGVRATVDGRSVVIGTAGLVGGVAGAPDGATHVTVDRRRGWAQVVVPARDGVESAVRDLARDYDIRLLSGDSTDESPRWRPLFGRAMAFAQSPEAKLAAVEVLRRAGRRVLMLGDGLNDAGALAAADVGIAVSDETAAMVPACDALIAGTAICRLPQFLRYGRRCRQVIVASFVVSVVYNAIGLALALSASLTPLTSAVLMPVSSLTVVLLGAGGMRMAARRMLPP